MLAEIFEDGIRGGEMWKLVGGDLDCVLRTLEIAEHQRWDDRV